MKFLAFEQTLKNSLTGLAMGGGKGGCDFDPKGKSDNEVMRFCQSFMTELSKYIGADTDVPAGDIGTGAREVGYMFGQYKRIRNEFTGVLTGKGLSYGGSLARPEATGYGLCYFTNKMLETMKETSFQGKKVVISGSGNVAMYALQKVVELGGTVVAMSDSAGYIYNEDGIDFNTIKEIKLTNRLRISEYLKYYPNTTYVANSKDIWGVKCDIALPCATQNEIDIEAAQKLVENNVMAVAEGANMPCTLEATNYFIENKVLYGPAKAANAGGVLVSGLEMSQNSMRLSWSFEEVDQKLKAQMEKIFIEVYECAKHYGDEYNTVLGANISGFKKVASAMMAQGVC
jgi:glutamate dehydrogenase (NADP+)